MKYLIWMVETAAFPKNEIPHLLEAFGSAKAVFAASEQVLEHYLPLKPAQKQAIAEKDLSQAEAILGNCKRQGIRIMSILDAEYPQRLKNIFDPPAVLYVRGRLPDMNSLPAIAVVGQRKATPYGRMAAEQLGYHLSNRGVVVVSGMAQGVDGAAHTGALQGKTPTVAVFGTAIDQCYPANHSGMLRQILRHGAAISEYPPGKRGYPSWFPQRNRIISGLCLGTVIVEAPKKSGSLITASLALDQGRDVFAVPANVDAASSEGCNILIQSGAKLVRSVSDILEEYEGLYDFTSAQSDAPLLQERPKAAARSKPQPAQEKPKPKSLEQVFGGDAPKTETEKEPMGDAHDLLLDVLDGPTELDAILARTGLELHQAMAQLTLLELLGKVRQLPGKQFEKTGL